MLCYRHIHNTTVYCCWVAEGNERRNVSKKIQHLLSFIGVLRENVDVVLGGKMRKKKQESKSRNSNLDVGLPIRPSRNRHPTEAGTNALTTSMRQKNLWTDQIDLVIKMLGVSTRISNQEQGQRQ